MTTETVLRGLAAVREEMAKRPANTENFEDKPKAKYVQLKDGDTFKLVFLQELDEGSPHYSAKNGVAIWPLMHTHPEDFKKKAKCTADLGSCYGCDQGWRQQMMLFINVLVDNGKEEPFVAIWNRGVSKNSVVNDLVKVASDEDFDFSITDKNFKFSREGSSKDNTTYTLVATPKPHTLNVEDYELFDLEKYVFTVAPDRQEGYYNPTGESTNAVVNVQTARIGNPAAAASDAEW